MDSKSIIKLVTIVGVTLITIVALTNYFSLQKEITLQDKETERVQLVQEEATHRTEERSGFWKKLVPWNNTDDPTFTREEPEIVVEGEE